jgi:hypothetical protein
MASASSAPQSNGNGAAPVRANASVLLARAATAMAAGMQFSGDRDLYEAYGYTKNPTFETYWERYRRQDIAGRIVDMPAEDTWAQAPVINDDDKKARKSAFESAFEQTATRLALWHQFQRVDQLAGIGHYAALLLHGPGDMAEPLPPAGSKGAIAALTPLPEPSVQIETYESDPTSERFNKPRTYTLTLRGDLRGIGRPSHTVRRSVHWTRVIHVASGVLEDDEFGTPRLERVLNLLFDLEKIVGACGEMFFRGGWGGKQFDLDPALELRPEDEAALVDELMQYTHEMSRNIRTRGVSIRDLTGPLGDPRGPFAVIIQLLSAATGIPQRMLMGAEAGQLASEQDTIQWRSRMRRRQERWAEPVLVRPFIDRLTARGYLPAPVDGNYEVLWPPISEQTEADKAAVVARLTRAQRDFHQAGGGLFMSAADVRDRLGMKGPPPPLPEPPPDAASSASLAGDRDVLQEDTSPEANV